MVWQEEKTRDDIWTPTKVGEEVVGIIIKIDDTTYGKQYLIENSNMTIKTPCHKALQNLMTRVEVGDKVKIVYAGSKPSGKGNATQLYQVFRDKPTVISEMLHNVANAKLV